MSSPASRVELRDYCLRALGFPVLQINVDEDQISDRIDEAFQFFQQFHYDAIERTYLKHQLTADDFTNQYIPIPSNIIGVTRIFSLSQGNLTQNMFDIRYQMRLQDIQSLTTVSMNYYYTIQTHLSLIDMLLVGEAPIRFNRHTDKIYLDWDWSTRATVGEYLIFEVQSILDPDTYTKVFNDMMLKKLCIALIKRQWGINMKKYDNLPLPGGVKLNGQVMYEEAIAEIEKLHEEIKETYQEPPRFFVA